MLVKDLKEQIKNLDDDTIIVSAIEENSAWTILKSKVILTSYRGLKICILQEGSD